MVNVSLTDAKARLSALVGRAARGEVVQITRRGKPVAQLSVVTATRKRIDVAALRTVTDAMAEPEGVGDDAIRTMRDEARY